LSQYKELFYFYLMPYNESLYQLFLESTGISIDTRTLKSGNLFFALPGKHKNGDEFVDEAFRKGAMAAIVDKTFKGPDSRCKQVADVLSALQDMACHHRQLWGKTLIAITGSNGKTTSKELCASVLREKYQITFTTGNYNNHIGVPLTLLKIRSDDEMAIVEMGANHPGEIAFLCDIAQPTHGVITNIGPAHLEGFGSIEGVLKAKCELYDYLAAKKGTVFIHSKYDHLMQAAGSQLTVVSYGEQVTDYLQAHITAFYPFLSMEVLKPAEAYTVMSNLYGDYNFENLMLAACIGHYMGMDAERIRKGLELYEPGNNRSQFIKQANQQIILDAYNANPASMNKAILQFSTYPAKRKIAIFGDMFELGKSETEAHQKIAALAESQAFDLLILIGKAFDKVHTQLSTRKFLDIESCIKWLRANPFNGKNTILIKGSRGMQLEQLIEVIK